MKKYLFLLLIIWSLGLSAQEKIPVTEQDYQSNRVEMADVMRAEGKIYVVVAVLVTIFAGITVYAVRIDRKISRLEKNMPSGVVERKSPA